MPREEEAAESTDLIVPEAQEISALDLITMKPKEYVAQVFQPFHAEFDKLLSRARMVVLGTEDKSELEAELMALPDGERPDLALIEKVDVTTPAGMATAIELRAAFRDDVRLAAEKTYRARKDPLIEVGRLLDGGFKSIKELTAPHEQRFDRAIKDEHARKERIKEEARLAEEARVAAIRAKIDELLQLPAKYAGATGEKLNAVLAELSERPITAEIYADLLSDAQLAYDTAGSALLVMMNSALEREEAEALRLAKQEEERVRLEKRAEELECQRVAAAAEQAERDRVAAETKRQLDAQAAQVAAARLAQEQERARLQAEHEARERAIVDIRSIQQLGELQGTRQVVDALQILRQMELQVEKFGSMLDMATMTRDMTITKLEQRLAGDLAVELPVAHLEALEDNALFDAARNKMLATTPAPVETAFAAPIDWDAPPADLPLPESVSELDAALDAGEEIDVTDLWILDSVASELGVTRRQMLARFQQIDLLELSALVEAED